MSELVPSEFVPSEPVKQELEGDLLEIYNLVKEKVNLIVSTGKFTPEHLRPIILDIVEVVQNYTSNKYDYIDGAKKKAIALNILRQVISDLYKNGQLSQSQYDMIVNSLDFFGGALIDLGKAAYKLLIQVVDDIAQNGCNGCFSRSCKK